MKTLITLNIGLLDTDGQAVNVHTAIFHLLSILKIDILASRVRKGKWEGVSEPVLVVSSQVIFDENFEKKLVELARSLRQSCVAVQFLDGTGRLYPAIYPFDASQFVELEKSHVNYQAEFYSASHGWVPLTSKIFKSRKAAEKEIAKYHAEAVYEGTVQCCHRVVIVGEKNENFLIEFSYDQENWKPIFNLPTLLKTRQDAEFEIEQLRRESALSQHRKAFFRIVKFNT